MYHPTTRVLAVLELLQTHGRMSGPDLAKRLEVDARTLRRYITMLQDLGIPIETERGRYGAYIMGAGFKLPPMMFTDDEALALAIGLLAARQLGLAEAAPSVESAQAKLERVMPRALKGRVRALNETIALDLRDMPIASPSQVMLSMSSAAQLLRRTHMRYKSSQDEESERDFDPYGLAYRQGRWYVVGHCHLRNDLRSFRLDRVVGIDLLDINFTRPDEFDTLAYMNQAIASLPREFPVEVLLKTDMTTAQDQLLDGMGLLTPVAEGVLLRGRTDDLKWYAHHLASLEFRFEVHQPDTLRQAVRELAAQLLESATDC